MNLNVTLLKVIFEHPLREHGKKLSRVIFKLFFLLNWFNFITYVNYPNLLYDH